MNTPDKTDPRAWQSINTPKIKVGIVSSSGATGGELLQLLSQHPFVEITAAQSHSKAGARIDSVHAGWWDEPKHFSADLTGEEELIFLCTQHGAAAQWLNSWTTTNKAKQSKNPRIIDLTADHRYDSAQQFTYGLSEWFESEIAQAHYVANPGCFATAIQLALLPFAAHRALTGDVHIHAITGATGAGLKLQATTQYVWRTENVSVYKAFEHQHLREIHLSIDRTLKKVQGKTQAEQMSASVSTELHLSASDLSNRSNLSNPHPPSLLPSEPSAPELYFVPVRGSFTRGIMASCTFRTQLSQEALLDVLATRYQDKPFVHLVEAPAHLKMVRNTNHACLEARVHRGMAHVVCCIDNLIKGAVGQAVQNMNIMQGWPQTTGLQLKLCPF